MGKQNERKPRCTGLIDEAFSWSITKLFTKTRFAIITFSFD